MTTIAFRDGLLAADTRINRSGTILSDNHQKITRLSNGDLLALAGLEAQREAMIAHLEDDEPLPVCEEGADDDFTALIATTDGSLYVYEGIGHLQRWEGDFYAIGTGSDFAIAAMVMGAAADEAVSVAMRCDVYSGGEVVSMKPGHIEEE